jgi:hypothetical protein
MAEIKSALEIAMERAAALGAGEDDSRREAEERGRALARRVLEGELEPKVLAGLSAGPPAARQAAARVLLEALGAGRAEALEGLRALAPDEKTAAAWSDLTEAVEARQAALAQLREQLAGELAGELAAAGIGGEAARPNPEAHPEYTARLAAALAGSDEELQAAGDKFLAALEGE